MCCSGLSAFLPAVQRKLAHYVPLCIASGVVGLACLAHVLRVPVLERLEWISYDARVRHALPYPSLSSTNLGFVSIDETTIQMVQHSLFGPNGPGLYWPRHVYGRLVNELAQQGAHCVAFDVIFGELRGDHASVIHDRTNRVESDEYFAIESARASNVVLAVNQDLLPPPLFATNAIALGDISTDKDADGNLRRVKAFRYYTNWHPAFVQAEQDPFLGIRLDRAIVSADKVTFKRGRDPMTGEKLGDIDIPLDSQGRFDLQDIAKVPEGMERFAPPMTAKLFWHMGIVLAAHELGLDLDRAEINLRSGYIKLPPKSGSAVSRTIPVDSAGFFYVDWSLPPNADRLFQQPMHQLLAQNAVRHSEATNTLPNPWKGKLVVVGSSALANDLTDRGATPLFKDNLLVSKHWNVANSVITGRFVRRLPLWMELGVVMVLGALTALVTWRLRSSLVALAVIAAIAAAYTSAALLVYIQDRLWMPLVIPLLSAIITQLGILTWRVVFEQAAQRRVRAMFSKMVSPKIVNEVLKMETLALGGARHEITVFFADVRGFTELTVNSQQRATEYIARKGLSGAAAEALYEQQAKETLDTVNTYLDVVAHIVTNNEGTLDKFIGDCVMAFWGAPAPDPKHALHCVRAAIQAQHAVRELNEQREVENVSRQEQNRARAAAGLPELAELPVLSLGTGLNTGLATAGLMGSARADSLSYTVFGREVNLASRLESASGHGRIFIGENTLAHLRRDDPGLANLCIPRDPVQLKGFSAPVIIYEVPWKTIDAMASVRDAQAESKALALG